MRLCSRAARISSAADCPHGWHGLWSRGCLLISPVVPLFVRRSTASAFVFAFLAACGQDDPVWSVTAVTDRLSLRGDNTDALQVQVAVLDDARNPAPVGSEVTIQCINADSQPFGNLNDDEVSALRLLTDDLGIAGTSFRCTNPTDATINVVCIVNYAAESARDNLGIQCTPGDPGQP